MFYWWMKQVLVGPLLRLMFRPWNRGVENVPAEGGVILASNHLAVIDSFVLPLVLDRKVQFLGKSDYFTGKGVKGRLTAGFMRGIGTIPVDRSGGKASEAALNTGLRVLDEGGLFGIYPEGTRSPDGRLHRGKTGVARLALESGAPVVPVAMIGTGESQPIGKRIPKPMRIGVVLGEPLDFSRYKGMEDDRFILRAVTDEIMYAVMRLSGQEYVDIYAATAKARMAAGHPTAQPPAGAVAPGGRPAPDVQVPEPPEEPERPSVD
ncbi:1-acyl-sn-glycerol-3-phosphate acyltransferase [Sediminihabitans luteus]|uniref:1-acyl-sn-glycerol-3-phosphate acyltransferase n=1 Tax=Sediminihabitans luteus TaxID=1138585 RepID=A0A2M9CQ54_9CELL|nr:lysophospholipid acyltransferase family protein [Sediminihabitans luteus]PJJ74056.1 1-acyl-sn-glycerol-3-phosphate acyltransferase [Sediminihabitans luteus]GII98029.1 1-acyl-sn-glycerol-3-phosphate acyltransferase [Sediminihabitans luteus]